MDLASIASFLLPTLLSALSDIIFSDEGKGNYVRYTKIFPSVLKSNPKTNMYGYGYRYPRVLRVVTSLYTDPTYRYKWARAAIMNRGTASRSPWIQFLRKSGTLEEIGAILREKGEEYRRKYGVSDKYRTAAQKRLEKLQNAIDAVQDANIQKQLSTEFGAKLKQDYVTDAINALKKEIKSLEALIAWQAPAEVAETEIVESQPPLQPSAKKRQGQGYGLRGGLGYGLREGLGYGYGYGYFY